MKEAVIVSAVRTPLGSFNGSLANLGGTQLGALAIEEAIQGLEGVEEIKSTASEGLAFVTLEAIEGSDVTRLWQEAKSEIDRIDTFPDEAGEPQVAIAARQREVLNVGLYGQVDEITLREAAEQMRDEESDFGLIDGRPVHGKVYHLLPLCQQTITLFSKFP